VRAALVGGAGFIGHNLALELRKQGHDCLVVDNLMWNSLVDNVMSRDDMRRKLNGRFFEQRFDLMREAGVIMKNADARNMVDLTNVLEWFQPTEIVHLSAISSAVDARRNPGLCFDLQLVTLRNVLEYARTGANRVVLMSSSTVYGDFETPTVDEGTRPKPKGIYANTKFMAERLCRTYSDQYGLEIGIVRPSALYGERCVSRRVSQAFIENALMGKPLILEGGGEGRLDFTYIDDLVDGIIRVLQAPGKTNTFNLTFGNARTIRELADIVQSVVPCKVENRPRNKDKPIRGTLSTARAEEILDFKAQWPLELGYRKYCEWYVKQWNDCR